MSVGPSHLQHGPSSPGLRDIVDWLGGPQRAEKETAKKQQMAHLEITFKLIWAINDNTTAAITRSKKF